MNRALEEGEAKLRRPLLVLAALLLLRDPDLPL